MIIKSIKGALRSIELKTINTLHIMNLLQRWEILKLKSHMHFINLFCYQIIKKNMNWSEELKNNYCIGFKVFSYHDDDVVSVKIIV